MSAALFKVQKAGPQHSEQIHNLINRVDINPGGLKWQRFLVALAPDGEFIGCGQIKPHTDGTRELASIAVEAVWRGRGVAKAIIETLLASNSEDLYLMCQSSLDGFYRRFGFHPIKQNTMPTYFRRVTQLPAMVEWFRRSGGRILVMYRPAP